MPWRPRLCSIKYGRTWHRVVPTVTPVTRAAPVWFPWLLLIFEDGCVCVCSPSVPILFRFLNIIPPVLFLWGLVDLRWAAGPYGAAVKAHSCVNVDVSRSTLAARCVSLYQYGCLSVCLSVLSTTMSQTCRLRPSKCSRTPCNRNQPLQPRGVNIAECDPLLQKSFCQVRQCNARG